MKIVGHLHFVQVFVHNCTINRRSLTFGVDKTSLYKPKGNIRLGSQNCSVESVHNSKQLESVRGLFYSKAELGLQLQMGQVLSGRFVSHELNVVKLMRELVMQRSPCAPLHPSKCSVFWGPSERTPSKNEVVFRCFQQNTMNTCLENAL